MTVFFTSDLHLGHEKVAEYRGFASVAEHDEHLAALWRDRVRPGDTVWVLGDVTASGSARVLGPALALLRDLPGVKHLVAGNHDACHPMHRGAWKHQETYRAAFASVQSAARASVAGTRVLLSHFPYERDRDEPRHLQWRLRDEGAPLLHGHTHGREQLTTSWVDPILGERVGGVEVHVGLDAWGLAPVPDYVVAGLLADAGVGS